MATTPTSKAVLKKRRSGRPPKFDEPRRPITVTLPVRIIQQLSAVNKDRAKAIARVTDAAVGPHSRAAKLMELVEVNPGKAVIVVSYSKYLDGIPWLRLVEIAPARYLLSIPPGTAIETIEVALGDILETVPPEEAEDRALLDDLRKCFTTTRRGRRMTKEEILLVDLAS